MKVTTDIMSSSDAKMDYSEPFDTNNREWLLSKLKI